MKILVVEDGRKISAFESKGLKEQGDVLDVCHDGDGRLDPATGESYDVTLLDMMLPGRDGFTLNMITREVKRGEKSLGLTSRKSNLLELLLRSPGRVCSRPQQIEHVWGYDFDPQSNVVDTCNRRVRSKIDLPDAPSPVEAARGGGYRIRAAG